MSALRFASALSSALLVLGGAPAFGQIKETPLPPGRAEEIVLTREAKGKELTLDEAVRNGLEYNPTIKQAAEKIGAQAAVVRQQLAAYYPTFTLNSQYQLGNQSGSTGINKHGATTDSILISPTTNLTLYNFGKREGTVQSARETLSATQYNLKTTADTVVLGVKQAYYSYLQARALVRVGEETLRDRELIVRQARAFFEVGTRAKIDVTRAESNFYNAQSGLIGAQNSLKVAWVSLKNAMGLPDLPEQRLPEVTTAQVESFAIIAFPLSLEQSRTQAFKIRPELLSFDAQLRSQDQTIATNRRGHLPDFILDSSFSARGSDSNASFANTFPLKPSWQVRVSVNVPIFNGFLTTNKVEESVRTYYSIRAGAEQQKQQVALEVEQGYANVVSAQERIKASKAAMGAAKENLDLANGRYQVGVGSIIEVTDAQQLYVQAEVDYVNSLYSYKVAEAQLLKAIGTP
jgi:outer membrane protein